MHAIRPVWMCEDNWHGSRVNVEEMTVVLEAADQKNILSAIKFYITDVPDHVKWNEITALSDLLIGVDFLPKNKVTVQWDSAMGRVIRRNKTAFHLVSKPEANFIETDKPTTSMLLRGMVTSKLNEKLKRDLHVIDLVAGNMYA